MTAVLGGVLLALRILGIVLGLLLLAVAGILLLPVGLDIRWSAKEGAVWQAKAGPLRFPLYPFPDQPAGPDTPSATTGKAKRRPKRKPKQPQEAPAPRADRPAQPSREPESPQTPPAGTPQPPKADGQAPQARPDPAAAGTPEGGQPDWGGLLAAGRTLAGALWPQRAKWLRRVRVCHLKVFWTVTGADAADTAISYGAYMAACNTALAVARDHLTIQSDLLRLEPDFTGEQKEKRSISCQILSRTYIILLVVRTLMRKDEKTGEIPLHTMLRQLGA